MANAFKQLHRIYNVIIGSEKEVTATESGGKVGLDVNVINPGGGLVGEVINSYNEVTGVASAVETTLASYTVPLGKSAYIQMLSASGTNISQYRVKVNGSVIAKKYTNFGGPMEVDFNIRNESDSSPGLLLSTGDVLSITTLHNRGGTGDFNANIIVFEVTP